MEDKENCSVTSTAIQLRSPGPKVAKMLDVFLRGSPRPRDPDSESETDNDSLPKYEFEESSNMKKVRAAQAARLNESYREATKVISKLLDSDCEDDDEATSSQCGTTSNLRSSRQTREFGTKKTQENTIFSNEQSGFDVQKFLKELEEKNTCLIKSDVKNESETPIEESPRPTAAVSSDVLNTSFWYYLMIVFSWPTYIWSRKDP